MRALTLCLCLLLPVAAMAQEPGQPTGTITVEATEEQDAAIATRIRAILFELDGYNDVTVAVNSGIVTLRGSTLDTATAARLNDLVGRVEGVVAIENEVAETTDVGRRLNPAVDRFRTRATQIVRFLPLATIALGVFILIVLIGFVVARRQQPWERLAPNAFIADIYRQVLRLVFVIGGLVVALDILNATALLSGILGAAGIVGLAIGFAVRDSVENFIASIMLSIRQPFRPNDTVEINGDIGNVIRLTSRATILLSFDGNHIRIPNATVFKSRIVNFSRNPERRLTFELGVHPTADLDKARTLALDTLNGLVFVLETPKTSVWIEQIGDSWVTLGMAAWINQNDTSIVLARSEAIRLTQAAFDEAGISADVPTYKLLHDGGALPQGATATSKAPQPEGESTLPPAPAVDVDATAEKELEKIVEIERAEDNDDLLGDTGKQE